MYTTYYIHYNNLYKMITAVEMHLQNLFIFVQKPPKIVQRRPVANEFRSLQFSKYKIFATLLLIIIFLKPIISKL